MSILIRRIALVLGFMVFAQAAWALSPADHLQCFKIKDAATKALYRADLAPTDPTFAPAAGCVVKVPAKLLCVDVVKSNVTPPPPGSPAGEAAHPYLCYQTKCPKAQPTANVSDQFGARAVQVKTTGLLCAPAAVSTTTTTTTTLPGATCSDSLQNGAETDVDCGGGTCPACNIGQHCGGAGDCTSGFCAANTCTAPSCTDTFRNGTETDVDCGGVCPPCALGKQCASGSDCTSGSCVANVCTVPSCTDGVKNGTETGIDCGGACAPCGTGQQCQGHSDCASHVCQGGICAAPSCTDMVKNGTETDVDCGGACMKCASGKQCLSGSDCSSGTCSGNVCI